MAQPFDSGKFNFCKALQKEVLFQFEPAATETFDPVVAVSGSPNLVFINVSPIEYGHVLLVPATLEQLPQLVSPKTMLLALHFAKAAKNAYFRLGFNSLGAYGTINHLHFQVCDHFTSRCPPPLPFLTSLSWLLKFPTRFC